MRPPLAALVLVALVLAGCSTGPDLAEPDRPQAPSSTAVPSVPSAPSVPVLTDTLHLLDAPHMAGRLPDLAEPLRTPLYADAPGVQHNSWALPRPDGLDLVDSEAHLFVDVSGPFVNTAADGCFWNVFLLVARGDGLTHIDSMCAVEPQVVQPGLHEIVLSDRGFDIGGDAGQEIRLQVSMNTVATPGSSASLLAGTSADDSTLSIAGLQLPLDTQTLLLSA